MGYPDNRKLLVASAVLFSMMVVAADYAIILDAECPDYAGQTFRQVYKACLMVLLLIGGYFITWNILYFLERKAGGFSCITRDVNKMPSLLVFFIPFAVITVFNIIMLFACKFPGSLTTDSILQINQFMSGGYTNHHPFYHTIVIKLTVNPEALNRYFNEYLWIFSGNSFLQIFLS